MLMKRVDSYLVVRRAAGFKLKDEEIYLKSYARFAEAQGEPHILTQTAIAWAGQSGSESQRATRLGAVIRFANFCHTEDSRHEIPPRGVFCRRHNRPVPYIYTEQEINALMAHALRLKPAHSLRPYMYNTLIGLLAVTGLRISEALALRFSDITDDGLLIRETKFRKTRLIPLHDSTKKALDAYLFRRRQLCTEEDHLFLSLNHKPVCRQLVYTTFHKLLAAAGISRKTGKLLPRLIDFRHTFATRALTSCPCSREHIGQNMLALQTYLGHAHVGCTYWYLESTPHLMCDIADKCQEFIEESIS